MKHVRVHIVLALLVLSLFFVVSFSEADEGYVECIINEFNLSVLIPDSYVVIYADMPESELSFLGIQKSDLNSILNSFSAQLYAEKSSDRKTADVQYYDKIVISVSAEQNDFDPFEGQSDEELIEMLEGASQRMEKQSDAYDDFNTTYSIYHTPEYVFICLNNYIPYNGSSQTLYYTFYNRRLLTIQFWFYSDVTDDKIEMMHTVCDSIHEVKRNIYESFISNKMSSEQNNKQSGQNLTYSDVSNGLVLTLPYGWKQEEFTIPKNYLSAKFSDNKGNMLMYGCLDYWYYLSDYEKKAYYSNKRNNADYTALTVSEVAEMYGLPKEKVSLIQRGGHWCYYTSISGMDVYIILENGRLYMFEFFVDSSMDSIVDELFENAKFSE